MGTRQSLTVCMEVRLSCQPRRDCANTSCEVIIRMTLTVLECQQGRGVSRAPRRDLKERLLEVQRRPAHAKPDFN